MHGTLRRAGDGTCAGTRSFSLRVRACARSAVILLTSRKPWFTKSWYIEPGAATRRVTV